MNAQKHRTAVKASVPAFLLMLTALLVCMAATEASAQGYAFSDDSQGWRYMGLYDGDGLNPVDDFVIIKNPWTDIDGDGGALLLGQEGFMTQSPTGAAWIHGDLNSPDFAYETGRSFGFSYDITGSHMASTAKVWVQAVIVVRQPNDKSDRRYGSQFQAVPLGENGAWDTHTYVARLPAGTIVKKINLRIFFETSSLYWGWIMVDNVAPM